jgi:4-hydroxyacetophenone monooxygenase
MMPPNAGAIGMVTEELKSASDRTIREALECADPMVLLGLIYHATGDEALGSIGISSVPMVFSSANIVPDKEQAAWVRARAFDLLTAYRDGKATPPTHVTSARLHRAMSLAAGEDVPLEELSLHSDVLDLDPTPKGWGAGPVRGDVDKFNVVVIGAGLAGINAAVQLKCSGIPFTLIEKNRGVGGTWHHNRYPGARVDWPSRLYSHSFGLDFKFRHLFAPREENEQYIRWCVERFDLTSHIELDTTVTDLRWDERRGVWAVHSRGPGGDERRRSARAVISAIGLLERPFIPEFSGLEEFEGAKFHSSRFDTGVNLSGKRAAVIGTGASGMQMVPDLAPLVDRLTVFQRSPGWILPVPGYRDPLPECALWLERNVPYYANWLRFILGWILGDHRLFKIFELDPAWKDPRSVNVINHEARERSLVHLRERLAHRPDLIEKCTPDYPIFANRPVADNGWFEAIARDNVELVSEPIARITKRRIVVESGREYEADLIVFATGFRPNDYFADIEVIGRNGLSIDEAWASDGPRAHWGLTVPGFPNFFMLYGPNANPRNLGPVQYGEWAMAYVLSCFKAMIEGNWKSMDVTKKAYDQFNASMDARLNRLVSVNPRTRHRSYYTNDFGRSAVQSPWSSFEVFSAFSNVRFEDYVVTTGDENIPV